MSKTGSSVSGWRVHATGRSRETDTGALPFRCGYPTTRLIRASTSTAASTNSSVISGCVPIICTDPTSTNSPGPTPTIPPGSRRCGASRMCSTCGSIPGRCPMRRCITRLRTATGSTTTTRGLHRRIHRADSRLVLHPARAGHRVVRPSGIQNLCGPRDCAGLRRTKMSKSRRNYPDVTEVFDRDGSDAMRWF